MGGGKGGGGCQKVGYGYALSMVYALVENCDMLSGYSWNDNIDFLKNEDGNGNINEGALVIDNPEDGLYELQVVTGKKGDVYSSDYSEKSYVKIYTNSLNSSSSRVKGLSYPVSSRSDTVSFNYPMLDRIKINDICCAVFEDAFVGDNTTQVPNYKFRLSRWVLKSAFYSGNDLNTLNAKIGYDINPVAVIYDLLRTFIDIPASEIDETSFQEAFDVCKNEGIGVSFIMTTEKPVTDWIKEVLRVIDGTLYYSIIDGKWKIYLIRKDDSVAYEINDYNATDISIKTGDWSNVFTTLTFKFSDLQTGNTNSFTIKNDALINILGYEKPKTYTFQLISNEETMSKIANKIVEKNSKPLSTLKCKLNFLDFPDLHIGKLIKIKSDELNIPEMYFRIIKIGGDKEYQSYVEIEAIEDIYRVPNMSGLYKSSINTTVQSYILTDAPEHYDMIALNNLFLDPNNSERVYALLPVCARNTDAIINSVGEKNNKTGNIYYSSLFTYGELEDDLPYIKDFDRDLEIIIKNVQGDTFSYDLSDEEWQKIKIGMIINGELFSIKTLIYNSNTNTFTLKGIMRGLNGHKLNHPANSNVWITFDYFSNAQIINTKEFDLDYDFYFKNLYNKSPNANLQKTISDEYVFRPFNPVNPFVENSEGKLYFSYSLRGVLSGDLQSADDVVAGDAEAQTEDYLQFNIYEGDTKFATYTPDRYDTTITIDVSGHNLNDIYVESVYKNDYKSDKIKAILL